MLGFLTSGIAGPLFGIGMLASVLLGGVEYLVQSAKIANLQSDNAKLSTSIDDPKTGYIARGAQCESNVATLKTSIALTSQSLKNLAAQEAALEAAAAKATASAQAGAKAADAAAQHILSLQPGGDVCKAALALIRNPAP